MRLSATRVCAIFLSLATATAAAPDDPKALAAAPDTSPETAPEAKALPPPVAVDPLQSVKDAILRALAVARRGGPAEKAAAGAAPVDRFIAALSEPDDELAWPLFKQISIDAPKEPWGEIGMAHVYVRWKLRDQAEMALARALRTDPQSSIALVEKAFAMRAFGDAAGAKSQAEDVLARDPNDARALLLLALLSEDAGAPKAEQQAAYERVLRASADIYEARLWMAGVAEQSGNSQQALEAVQALAQMNPRDLPTQRKLGNLQRAAGNHAAAAAAYERAVALGDTSKETWVGLAASKRALKDSVGEEQALRRWHRIAPKERAVIARLYVLREEAQDEPGMEEQARGLLAIDGKDAGAHLLLARRRAAANDLLGELDELTLAAAGHAHDEDPKAPAEARAQLAALRGKLELPERRLTASNPDGVYRVSSRHLTALYEEVRREKPELRGNLAVQLKVNATGSADSVEVTEDTLKQPALTQKLVAALREGEWPKAKKTLTLRYELAPPGTHTVAASENDAPHARKKKARAPEAEKPPDRPSTAAGLSR